MNELLGYTVARLYHAERIRRAEEHRRASDSPPDGPRRTAARTERRFSFLRTMFE